MAILDIVTWPDKRLTERSKPVKKIDKDLQKFMDDMLETMYDAQGLGLSAVQVGVMKRVIVIDIGHESNRYPDESQANSNPLFIVNPKIIKESKRESNFKEGCLSFPGQFADVIRPEEVTVEYLDYNGEKQTLNADGILATCIQHEIDHLDGVVFVDHVSKLKRDIIIKKVLKRTKQ